MYVGGTGEVSTACFAPFSYTALGHLHAPQRAGEHGRYAGSPLKYSFDEANQEKSVTVVEFDGEEPRISFRSFPPLRDLRVLTGSFEELLARAKAEPCEDYLLCELTDNGPVYLPAEQLRPYWPNLLGLSSRWLAGAGEGSEDGLREQLRHNGTDASAVLREFLTQICGYEPDANDEELFLTALRGEEEEEA